MFSRNLVILLITYLFHFASAQQKCYFPDGSLSVNDTPCGSGSNITHCCGNGAICLDNGLCMAVKKQPLTLTRASCTDQTWSSPSCPKYCLQRTSYNDTGCAIISYSYINNVALYCCNNIVSNTGNTPCDQNSAAFQIENASIMPGYAALADYTVTNSSTKTTTSSSGGSSSSSNRAAIGAGVGVPLGVIALGAIAWAIWERRKLHRVMTTQPQQGQQGGYNPYTGDKTSQIQSGGVPPLPLQPMQPQYEAEMSAGETAAVELEGRSS